MSRIDFAFGAHNRLLAACQAVSKHYHAGRKILVYSRDTRLMQRFDRLLWAYDSVAFIPHVYHDDTLASHTLVVLYTEAPAAKPSSPIPWLLNLDLQCPPFASQFNRILEIVSQNPDDISAARQRWKAYQAQGHLLHAHDLSKRQTN